MGRFEEPLFATRSTIGVPIAALGFLNPIIAAAAMALSSLSVIVNSALLRRLRMPAAPMPAGSPVSG